jgi:hypothetical protein
VKQQGYLLQTSVMSGIDTPGARSIPALCFFSQDDDVVKQASKQEERTTNLDSTPCSHHPPAWTRNREASSLQITKMTFARFTWPKPAVARVLSFEMNFGMVR